MPHMTTQRAAEIGRLGGLKTKQRLKDDPEFYSRIGLKGGQSILAKYGPDYYVRLGRMSKKEAQP